MKPSHIIVLVIVLVVVFGASKLPDVAKYFGQSLKVLRKEMREFHDDEDSASAAKSSGSARDGRASDSARDGRASDSARDGRASDSARDGQVSAGEQKSPEESGHPSDGPGRA